MIRLSGKVSWFGGPDDLGVASDEDLAFIYDVSDQPSLFLDEQPPGTTGLARRLDPETFYIAMRWDYDETSRDMLLDMRVEVRNPKTGKSCVALPADWGPHSDTDRIADCSPAVLEYLDLVTDDEIEISYPYQEDQPMSNEIPVCIDISHWQDFPDFDEVYASGVRGMIHKATEGTTYVDPNRSKNCSNALAAGLAISTYMWIKPGDGAAQAEFYLATIDPTPGERVVIDYEEDGCSLTTLKNAVQAILDYGNELKITVYSGHLLKEVLGDSHDAFLAQHTDLWLAQYTSDESKISWPEATYPKWTLWQYSETGEIPGIDDSYVDLNNYNGNDQEFLEWINPTGVKPKPPKPVDPVKQQARETARRTAKRVVRRMFKRGPDIGRS